MQCGHCAAVCPNDAINVESLSEERFYPVKEISVNSDDLLALLKHRRSVRRYSNKPVPREEIQQIINAVNTAPTGIGRASTGIIVIDHSNTLSELSSHFFDSYKTLKKNLKNPVARFFIGRKAGQQKLRALRDFVMPGMHWYIRWYEEGKSNEILRDCPVLILFHSPKFEPAGPENCLIAAFHAVLMAQVRGIGTCLNDLIPPMCNRNREIRKILALPENREVYSSITMGYPRYSFKKTIPRKAKEIRYI
jgi:nitroreductase